MNIAIGIPCWKRNAYTVQVIEALRKCVIPADTTVSVFLFPEGPFKQSAYSLHGSLVDHFPLSGVVPGPDTILGCNRNTRRVVEYLATRHPDSFCVVLEDDCVPSPDFLLYTSWAAKVAEGRADVLSVCGFNRVARGASPDPAAAYLHARRFCSWGYGFWPGMLCMMMEAFNGVAADATVSWDVALSRLMMAKDMCEIRPALSRIKNIGAVDGAYNPNEAHHRHRFYGLPVASDADVKTVFRFVDSTEADKLTAAANRL